MNITPESQVAEIASRNPATIRIFQRFGIDFCCGGRRPLGEVCGEKQMTFGELRAALEAVEGMPAELPAADAKLADLVRFIVDKYHASLREELPRLWQMLQRVQERHGAKYSQVSELAQTFRGLWEELDSHMMKEEQLLFPYAERLEEMASRGRPLSASPFGSIQAPIGAMEEEHDSAARALARMRELTGGYTPPADACATFRGLYFGLSELDKALKEHIHLENNVLFPRAARLEEEVLESAARVS